MDKEDVAHIYLDKIDFKTKTITNDKNKKTNKQKKHYIVIKGSLQQDDITIVNIYEPNIGDLDT